MQKFNAFLINLFTPGNFVDYKGLFGLKEKTGGMEENKIELAENKLILD